MVYDRDHSSLHDFRINQIDFDQLFEGVSLFHFSGITLSLDESIQEITLLLLKEAKKREITISLDLNFRSKLISPKNAKILFLSSLPLRIFVLVLNLLWLTHRTLPSSIAMKLQ